MPRGSRAAEQPRARSALVQVVENPLASALGILLQTIRYSVLFRWVPDRVTELAGNRQFGSRNGFLRCLHHQSELSRLAADSSFFWSNKHAQQCGTKHRPAAPSPDVRCEFDLHRSQHNGLRRHRPEVVPGAVHRETARRLELPNKGSSYELSKPSKQGTPDSVCCFDVDYLKSGAPQSHIGDQGSRTAFLAAVDWKLMVSFSRLQNSGSLGVRDRRLSPYLVRTRP